MTDEDILKVEELLGEIERLKGIIKDIHKTLEDNYGGLPIFEYERLIELTKRK